MTRGMLIFHTFFALALAVTAGVLYGLGFNSWSDYPLWAQATIIAWAVLGIRSQWIEIRYSILAAGKYYNNGKSIGDIIKR